MLSKVLIAAFILGILAFFAYGFLQHKDEITQDIKPKEFSAIKKGAPACPDPLIIQTPVDLNKVTSILYPGQERGGTFRPHGGFRFDTSEKNEIEVEIPMDATFTDASRYIEGGEVQYMFDFLTSCDIMYRFDHLLILTPKFAKIVENLPEAKENDSRTTPIEEEVKVTQGEIIATAVGHTNNVFVDFGVYDLRGKTDLHNFKENAVCWFDLLPESDSARVKSLPPGDSKSGTSSIYCK